MVVVGGWWCRLSLGHAFPIFLANPMSSISTTMSMQVVLRNPGAPEIITGNRTTFEYVSLHVIVHSHCLLISLSRVEEVSSKSQSDPAVHFPRTWQQHRWHVKILEGTAQRFGIMVQNSVCGGGNMKHMVQ